MSFWVVNAQPKDRLRLNILCKIPISDPPLPLRPRKGQVAEPRAGDGLALYLPGQDGVPKASFGPTLYCTNALLLEVAES